MTIEEWAKDFKGYVNELQMPRDDYNGIMEYINDALSLLKEQEAVEPTFIENPYTHLPVSYCPKCREPISMFITGNPYKKTKYCHYCGQNVKWDN